MDSAQVSFGPELTVEAIIDAGPGGILARIQPAWIRPPWTRPPEKLHFAKEEKGIETVTLVKVLNKERPDSLGADL